jgi:hypothetical protein
LQLLEYLEDIDSLLGPLALPPITKDLYYFELEPQMVIVQYSSANCNDVRQGLALSRTFIKKQDELIVEHDFFRIPLANRNLGIGKSLLRFSLEYYINMDVDKIKVEAALDDGGYVWARALFAATEPAEVTAILTKASGELPPSRFKFVKRIYNNYYDKHPGGRAFPMNKWAELPGMEQILRGCHWHGEIDLNNNELLANFINYVGQE